MAWRLFGRHWMGIIGGFWLIDKFRFLSGRFLCLWALILSSNYSRASFRPCGYIVGSIGFALIAYAFWVCISWLISWREREAILFFSSFRPPVMTSPLLLADIASPPLARPVPI